MAKKSKKLYSAAEIASFKRGMQTQYNRDYPKVNYEVVTKCTTYNSDGSVCSSYDARPVAYKRKSDALAVMVKNNKDEKSQNEHVLKAVKAKKVNEYNSYDCTTHVSRVEKVNRRAKFGEKVF